MKKITLLFLVVFVTLTGFAQLKPASFSRNNERFVPKAVYQHGRFLSGHHTISIPVSGLEQGVYFVSVVINNERQTRKLIVE